LTPRLELGFDLLFDMLWRISDLNRVLEKEFAFARRLVIITKMSTRMPWSKKSDVIGQIITG